MFQDAAGCSTITQSKNIESPGTVLNLSAYYKQCPYAILPLNFAVVFTTLTLMFFMLVMLEVFYAWVIINEK